MSRKSPMVDSGWRCVSNVAMDERTCTIPCAHSLLQLARLHSCALIHHSLDVPVLPCVRLMPGPVENNVSALAFSDSSIYPHKIYAHLPAHLPVHICVNVHEHSLLRGNGQCLPAAKPSPAVS